MEEVEIIHIIQADDWWALYDWPDWSEYKEEPIICFASYKSTYKTGNEVETYTGIGCVVEDWSNGNSGIDCAVITINNKEDHGILQIYKGKGQHGKLTLDKPSASA